jgi:hypothetical protein
LTVLAKQQLGLRYAAGGGTGTQHMTVQWFARLAGITLEHVPYDAVAKIHIISNSYEIAIGVVSQ